MSIENETQNTIRDTSTLKFHRKVRDFAEIKHGEQKDRGGKPYVHHLISVSKWIPSDLRNVAYLHDILEDTDTSIQELKDLGLNDWEIEVIMILTKKKHQTYEQYIEAIKKRKEAVIVKLADLEDNMNLTRLPRLTDKDLKRIKKYHKAYMFLKR